MAIPKDDVFVILIDLLPLVLGTDAEVHTEIHASRVESKQLVPVVVVLHPLLLPAAQGLTPGTPLVQERQPVHRPACEQGCHPLSRGHVICHGDALYGSTPECGSAAGANQPTGSILSGSSAMVTEQHDWVPVQTAWAGVPSAQRRRAAGEPGISGVGLPRCSRTAPHSPYLDAAGIPDVVISATSAAMSAPPARAFLSPVTRTLSVWRPSASAGL